MKIPLFKKKNLVVIKISLFRKRMLFMKILYRTLSGVGAGAEKSVIVLGPALAPVKKGGSGSATLIKGRKNPHVTQYGFKNRD